MFKDDKQVDELMFLMYTAKKMVWERAKGFKDIDLNSALRFATLQLIIEKKNPTMKEVARFLRIKPPSVTSLISGFVRSEYIERMPDKIDRRIIRLKVTKKGEIYFKKYLSKIRDNIKSIYSHLTGKEINQLIKILKKIAYVYRK